MTVMSITSLRMGYLNDLMTTKKLCWLHAHTDDLTLFFIRNRLVMMVTMVR